MTIWNILGCIVYRDSLGRLTLCNMRRKCQLLTLFRHHSMTQREPLLKIISRGFLFRKLPRYVCACESALLCVSMYEQCVSRTFKITVKTFPCAPNDRVFCLTCQFKLHFPLSVWKASNVSSILFLQNESKWQRHY